MREKNQITSSIELKRESRPRALAPQIEKFFTLLEKHVVNKNQNVDKIARTNVLLLYKIFKLLIVDNIC